MSLRWMAVLAVAALALEAHADTAAKTWSFDGDEADAPTPGNVLAQSDSDSTDYRFPVAVADAPALKDLRLSVKCGQVAGEVDQGCGLVSRYKDADNCYVTRADTFDGKQVIDAKDDTFGDAGKVGVRTKAESIIYFDDLSVQAL